MGCGGFIFNLKSSTAFNKGWTWFNMAIRELFRLLSSTYNMCCPAVPFVPACPPYPACPIPKKCPEWRQEKASFEGGADRTRGTAWDKRTSKFYLPL